MVRSMLCSQRRADIATRRNEIQCSRNWRRGDAIRCPDVTPRNCGINFRSQSGCQTVKCHSIRRVRRLKHMFLLQQDLVSTPKVRFNQVVVDDRQQRAVCTHMLDTTPEPFSTQAHLDQGPCVHTRSCRTLRPLLKHVRAEACNCAHSIAPQTLRFIYSASNLASQHRRTHAPVPLVDHVLEVRGEFTSHLSL